MKHTGKALLASLLAIAPVAGQVPFDAGSAKSRIDAALARSMPDLLNVYKDLHQHPEVAFQEKRSAGVLAARMRKLGFQVTEGFGGTGVVAVYRNGAGPTVLVRTELDALPMEEKTGLPYASRAQQIVDGKPSFVDHSCGHDTHMAWWLGTAEALLAMKDRWRGTLLFIGQPAEEALGGAKAMLEAGLLTRFPKPDYAFAAHVDPTLVGTVGVKQGVVSSAADVLLISFKGVGTHGSTPELGIDPIVEGAEFVSAVQTIVSRRKSPHAFGVITVGSFNAGTVANIVPDHADLALSIRSFAPEVRTLLTEGAANTAKSIAAASGAPAPEIRHTQGTGSVINDPALAAEMAEVLRTAIGHANVKLQPSEALGGSYSEDYSEFVAAGIPQSVFFTIGGYDADKIERYRRSGELLPGNHSPFFAPDPEPAIHTGVTVLTLAVLKVTSGT